MKLFLTRDKLIKNNVSEGNLVLFDKFFPSGAGAKEFFQHRWIPREFMLWVSNNFNLSKEEEVYCNAAIGNKDSSYVYNSDNVNNSLLVTDSTDILLSRKIKGSKLVKESFEVLFSENIEKSSFVYMSKDVSNSESIFDSTNISDSMDIYNSNNISSSLSIFRSSDIKNSYVIRSGQNLKNCLFCADVENMENAMFCSRVADGKFYIFNQAVPEDLFSKWYEAWQPLILGLKMNYSEGKVTERVIPIRPRVYEDFSKHYKFIPIEFWEKIWQYPFYKEDIIYNITMNKKLLENL